MVPVQRRVAALAPVLLAFAIVLVAAEPAHAQRDGVIAGRIVDLEGNPVANATITVHSIDRGATRTLTTNDNGEYMGRGLTPEVYAITIEADGFGTQRQEMKINLGMNTVDVVMSGATLADSRDYEQLNELYEAGFEAWQAEDWDGAKASMLELLDGMDGLTDADANKMRLSAYEILGQSHFRNDELDEAQAAYETMLELDADHLAAHSWLAQVHSRREDFEAALPHLRRAAELSPDDAALQYNAGAVMLQLGVTDEGIAAMERAVTLRPEFPIAHKNLGYAYLQAAGSSEPEQRDDFYAKALASLRLYLEQSPEAADRADIEGMVSALAAQLGQ